MHRWRRLGMVVAAVCAALVVPDARAAPAPSAVPPALRAFFQYTRPAAYGSTRHLVQVPMRDGVRLGCFLYEPTIKGTSKRARGRFPGIVNNLSPYAIAYPFDVFGGSYFAERGYLNIECMPRGTGLSGGVFPGWLSAIENRDNYDLIEWLAQRPNASGKVGQEGNSYGGMTAYRVAALRPPSLVTIAPQQSYASLYLEYTYPGGIRSLGDPYWWAFAGAVGFVRPMVSAQELRWLLHPRRDAYWQQIDIDNKWDRIDIPVLGFGGWIDIFQDGMARNHIGLAGPNTYLIEGPWDHSNTFDDDVTLGALLAWFDRWLYGDPRAPLPPSPVASYRMPNGPWQVLPSWPPPAASSLTLALTTAGRLAEGAGAAGRHTYVVNTAAGLVDLPARDHLVFRGTALARPLTIAGAGAITLVSTLRDPTHVAPGALVDTNFVFRLYDVSPLGAQRLVTRGFLKASHRQSHTVRTRLPIGEPVTYDVPLWHVHHQVAAGHRLELRLQSGDQDCCLLAAPAVTQPLLPLTVSVATGSGGSSLTLPVLPD